MDSDVGIGLGGEFPGGAGEREGAVLQGEKPRGDQGEENLRADEIGDQTWPSGGRGR